MAKKYDVVIVGAGITGLVTAYKLYKEGFRVKVLEQNIRVGGIVQSSNVDGFLLEYGPNSFQESDEINELIKELNLSSELVTADPKMPRYVYFQGKLQPVPLSPPALLSSKLLSLKGKLRILAEPVISKRNNLSEKTEESIASFMRRRLGNEIHDRLVSPFVSGVYAGNTEKLSLQASFPTLAELENKYGSLILGAIKSRNSTESKEKRLAKRLCSFANGLVTLPQTLAKELIDSDSLALNSKMLDLTISKETPYYKIKMKKDNTLDEISTDHLVLATPAYITANFLENYFPKLAIELKAIEYVSMVIVHLSLSLSDLSQELNGFGFLIPRSEGIRLLGEIWSSCLFPNRAPKDKVLLTNFIGGAHDSEAIRLTDLELTKIIGEELKHILKIKVLPNLVNVYRYEKAIPQYNLGHLSRLRIIESELKSQPNLYLASNYLQGVSVPDCVSRGKKLAESIKNSFKG
ncbi:MAG: protoporphyrinogen oxidase [Acidobacteria bacterium]|nr:protoporphyrinogen oxidase [Acidobacteriota bacterium]